MRHGVLSYRKKPELAEHERSFNLSSIALVEAVAGLAKGAKRKYSECAFSIQGPATSGEVVVLLADSTAERDRWVKKVTDGRAWATAPRVRPSLPRVDTTIPASVLRASRGWQLMGPSGGSTAFASVLHDPEELLAWYRKYISPMEHRVYLAADGKAVERAPILVALARVPADSGGRTLIRAALFGAGMQRRVLLHAPEGLSHAVPASAWTREDLDLVLGSVDAKLFKARKHFKPVSGDAVAASLLKLESLCFPRRHKFGVLYALDGQTDEAAMLANDIVDATGRDRSFVEFLSLLGTSIELLGWDGYRAGLDVEAGGTGTHAVFREHHGLDIMFHVSTHLPHDRELSGQEVQRKRQIGNDICAIVFMNGTTPYDPATIKCQFLHVYAVVQPDAEPGYYRIQFARQSALAEFGAPFSSDRMRVGPEAIDFLLTKLVNGERTALATAPDFRLMQKNTDTVLLSELTSQLARQGKPASSAATLAPVSAEAAAAATAPPGALDGGPRRRAIPVLPHARALFEAHLVPGSLPAEVSAWDHWQDSKHVFSAPGGTYISDTSGDPPILLTSVEMAQLFVLADLGVAVGRSAVTRLAYVIYLHSIGEWMISVLKASKQCASLDVRCADGEIHLALTVRHAVHFYQWKEPGAFFLQKETLVTHNTPVYSAFVHDGRMAVVEPYAAYLIHPETGVTTQLVTADKVKIASGFVCPLQHAADERVFVSTNLDGVVLREAGAKACVPPINLAWSLMPTDYAVFEPYVLALSFDTIEIRSCFDGSLVQSMQFAPPLRIVSRKDGLFVASGVEQSSIYQVLPALPELTSAAPALAPLGGTSAGAAAAASSASAAAAGSGVAPGTCSDLRGRSIAQRRLTALGAGAGARRPSIAALSSNRPSASPASPGSASSPSGLSVPSTIQDECSAESDEATSADSDSTAAAALAPDEAHVVAGPKIGARRPSIDPSARPPPQRLSMMIVAPAVVEVDEDSADDGSSSSSSSSSSRDAGIAAGAPAIRVASSDDN